jgi:poly(3-hydroxybutyrate) depolymerase
MEADTRFSDYADSKNIFVMYPEPYGAGAWHGCWDFFDPDSQKMGGGDAAKLVEDIKAVAAINKIDSSKIFAAGMSAGASVLNVVTACYPEVLSGVVIHSGMAYGLADTWQSSLKLAKNGPMGAKRRNLTCNPQNYHGRTILVQGTNDSIMNPAHYDLLKQDYFTGAELATQRISGNEEQFDYLRESFSLGGRQVGLGILVQGMRHDWSGGDPRIPFDKKGPDVTPMIINEFLNKP